MPPRRTAMDAAAITEPTEGRMRGEKEEKTDGLDAYRQEAVLLNGTKMRYGQALAAYEILLDMHENAPDQFQALVALVKGNARVAEIDPNARAALRRRWAIRADGSVRPDLAAVLEAAANDPPASPDEPPLRYPIVHTDPAHFAELKKLENEKPRRLLRDIFGPDQPGEDRSR